MSGSLPQTMLPQTSPLGRVDADGNVIIDTTWYLLLYNVVMQAISPQNGTITPSPLDLAFINEEDGPQTPTQVTVEDQDNAGADIAQVRSMVLQLQSLIADMMDYVPGGTSTGQLSVITGSGAPTDGVTGAGISPEGGMYLDQTTPDLYINAGTMAVPTWKIFGRAG